jgi:hypothetical protein
MISSRGDGESPYVPHYSRLLPVREAHYTNRPIHEKIALKLGQRKLLFNELEFYTKYATPGSTVVYVGSASGIHSVAFARLFPEVHFIFYDPNAFYSGLADCANIETHQMYFTDEIAQQLQTVYRDILFLSDIRTGEAESYVVTDMEFQKRWCDILKPRAAMLKFRLPWASGKTEYYAGDIYTQPRIGATSTETRLWVTDFKFVEYDNDVYNNRVFYYQKYCRNAFHDIPEHLFVIPGLDHCHDCWSEIKICQDYISAYPDVFKSVVDLMEYISECTFSKLDVPPHGLMRDERDVEKRIEALREHTISADQHRKEHKHEFAFPQFKIAELRAQLYATKIPRNLISALKITPAPRVACFDSKSVAKLPETSVRPLHEHEKYPSYYPERANTILIAEFCEKSTCDTVVLILRDLPENIFFEMFPKQFILYSIADVHEFRIINNVIFFKKKFDEFECAFIKKKYGDVDLFLDCEMSPVHEKLQPKLCVCDYSGRETGKCIIIPWADKATTRCKIMLGSEKPPVNIEAKIFHFHVAVSECVQKGRCYNCRRERKIFTKIFGDKCENAIAHFMGRLMPPHDIIERENCNLQCVSNISNYMNGLIREFKMRKQKIIMNSR